MIEIHLYSIDVKSQEDHKGDRVHRVPIYTGHSTVYYMNTLLKGYPKANNLSTTGSTLKPQPLSLQ